MWNIHVALIRVVFVKDILCVFLSLFSVRVFLESVVEYLRMYFGMRAIQCLAKFGLKCLAF